MMAKYPIRAGRSRKRPDTRPAGALERIAGPAWLRSLAMTMCLLVTAWPALAAKEEAPAPACEGKVKPQLFLSPMGEPFRPTGDDDDPVKRWFVQADRDHEGKLTAIELLLDADRFFLTLDKDGDGELLPPEVHAYEQDVAPEIRLYQRRTDPKAPAEADRRTARADRATRATIPGDGAIGAGRYAFLNIPNPVASADLDLSRSVSRQEFRAAAAERFDDLDVKQEKALTIARLPKTPAQLRASAICASSAQGKKRR